MILLGPGSLYTSIIPNLLVEGIAQAIMDSDALKIYIANVMTQEGETEGYTNADHIQAIFQHSLPGLFHLCLANSANIPAWSSTPRRASESPDWGGTGWSDGMYPSPSRGLYEKTACRMYMIMLLSCT